MNNLVCIPAGSNSKHKDWNELHTNHNFDLCLLEWEPNNFLDKNTENAKYRLNFSFKDTRIRFKMFSQFVEDNDLSQYKRIFWVDDDIETSPPQIEEFLNLCEEYNFDLAQPSLTRDSYFTYPITVSRQNLKFRLTNTVEIMMPCFTQRALNEILDVFKSSKYGYGWGMELMWDKRLHKEQGISIFGGRIGIIDQCAFKHGRPIGNNGLYFLGSPQEEIQDYERIYNVNWKAEYKFIEYGHLQKVAK